MGTRTRQQVIKRIFLNKSSHCEQPFNNHEFQDAHSSWCIIRLTDKSGGLIDNNDSLVFVEQPGTCFRCLSSCGSKSCVHDMSFARRINFRWLSRQGWQIRELNSHDYPGLKWLNSVEVLSLHIISDQRKGVFEGTYHSFSSWHLSFTRKHWEDKDRSPIHAFDRNIQCNAAGSLLHRRLYEVTVKRTHQVQSFWNRGSMKR